MNAQRAEEYRTWLAALNRPVDRRGAEAAIRDALNEYIDNWLAAHAGQPEAAFCSSWIPGPKWEDTPYEPIYDTMVELYVDEDMAFEQSKFFFGLFVLDVVEARESDNGEEWDMWHEPHQRGIEPLGLFYRPKVRTAA